MIPESTNPQVQQTQAMVSFHMDAILALFRPGARITVLVRSPDGERESGAQDFVMTNDELPAAAAMIERRIPAS